MARETALSNTKVFGPNVATAVVSNVVSQSSSFYIDTNELDERTTFVFTPGSSSTNLTVKAGTGYAGTKDYVISASSASTEYAFTLDSARYAIASGENAGLIHMIADKAGTFKIIQVKV